MVTDDFLNLVERDELLLDQADHLSIGQGSWSLLQTDVFSYSTLVHAVNHTDHLSVGQGSRSLL